MSDINEAETRAEYIDKQLEQAGWTRDADIGMRIRREYIINDGKINSNGKRDKQLKADYLLEYQNTPIAVIEAKSSDKDIIDGVAQAKIYAQKLQLNHSFVANGKDIYYINMKTGEERHIDHFPTPQELLSTQDSHDNKQQPNQQQKEWHKKFNHIPFEPSNNRQPRYYQQLAVNRVMNAIADDKKRILLTLATGTGKTFIAFQIAWKLFQSRWNLSQHNRQPRILFITDRNILADQTYLDFSAFADDARIRITPDDIKKRGDVPKNGSIFFTIFQSFMSGDNDTPYFGKYPPDFFDMVIIDECHRGGANDQSNWRNILDYFNNAVHLGLTATPKRNDNIDTYDYFGDPVFIYSLKEGIEDGFLTAFKVKRIQSNIDDYIYQPDDEVIQGDIDESHVYDEYEINHNIIIKEREEYRINYMFQHINPNEKTIIFCANQYHAGLIRNLINQTSYSNNVDYCVRVCSDDGVHGDTYLKQFRDNEKTIPTILTTSTKLSTGVDARNIRNIVLMRPINNIIEFKQIIGRGTRLYDDKFYFTIVDFVNAYHHFNDPEWDGEPIEPEPSEPSQPSLPMPKPKGDDTKEPTEKIIVKLSDGRVRELQSITDSYFYIDNKMVNAETYIKHLFDVIKLPEILESEEKLRQLWSSPLTRKELLKTLEKAGCTREDLEKLQEIIGAKNSDLFDVLEYIAYAKPTISRQQRVDKNKDNIYNLLNNAQREFIEFVLQNYIKDGLDELDDANLANIINAKYGSPNEAQQKLGAIQQIRDTFIKFQQNLYKNVG